MTIVEFFDNNAIENVVSALLCSPDKVILLGKDAEKLEKAKNKYSLIAKDRNLSVKFDYKAILSSELEEITEKLREIALSENDLIFDLTGGDDLYLVSVGRVFSEYPEKVKLHRFNIDEGVLVDADADGKILRNQTGEISVRENIRVYGGDVIEKAEGSFTLDELRNDNRFFTEINTLWGLAKDNTDEWNSNLKNLSAYNSRFKVENSLDVKILVSKAEDISGVNRNKLSKLRRFLRTLSEKKVIFNLRLTPDEISFTFKNARVRKLLITEGLVLEGYIGSVAARMKDTEGNYLFNDVQTGVNIDWNGEINLNAPNVKNEIDVVVMRGIVPIFISCKNGAVETEEPYKLETVARRFGGKYAKTTLIVSALKKGSGLIDRAREMDITLIKNAEKIKKSTLIKILSSI